MAPPGAFRRAEHENRRKRENLCAGRASRASALTANLRGVNRDYVRGDA